MRGFQSLALSVLAVLFLTRDGWAQTSPPHEKRGSEALMFDVTTGFVPFANDVPVMLGAGVRFAKLHEIWGRAGYMPTGDDQGYAFGVGGYRAVFRPGKIVRPFLGGLFAGLPATCSHLNNPECTTTPLFIFAAHGGVRIEPLPWLGISLGLSLGTDSYPNPFGMVELGVSFAIPLS